MKSKRIISVVLLSIMAVTVMFNGVGCNSNKNIEQIDNNRTQLYVANYDGGNGHAWLDKIKVDFEEEYKDVSFEEGKVGVQIMPSNEKDVYHTNSIISTIKTSSQEVYFASGDNLDEFLSGKLLLDITDAVTEPLPGETKSIKDKMKPQHISHFERDGKFYSIPNSASVLGVVYDVDLFDDESLFLQEGGGYTNLEGNLASGPDGEKGTYDDGLPATYEEFFELCSVMMDRQILPLSWAGKTAYTDFLFKALWADYEGYDKANIEFNAGTVSGKNTTDIITGFDMSDNPIIDENYTISLSNYKDIAKQAGRYYALKFFENIIENDYYYQKSTNINQTMVMAQYDFLASRWESDERIAMLIEGDWWEREALDAGTFDDLVYLYGEEASMSNRRFAFLPMPKVSNDKLGKGTLYNSNGGSVFINANIAPNKIRLAKTFLKFCHTDKALNQYTQLSGSLKAFNYNVTDETKSNLSYFSKSCITLLENIDVIEPYFSSLTVEQSVKTIQSSISENSSKINGKNYNHFFTDIKNEVTAREYFEGLYNAIA